MRKIIDSKEVLEILKELERLGMNRKFVCEYDREKVNKKLMNSLKTEGRLEGISQGIEQEKVNIARNSLRQNLSVDTISAITGLSIREINSIKVWKTEENYFLTSLFFILNQGKKSVFG